MKGSLLNAVRLSDLMAVKELLSQGEDIAADQTKLLVTSVMVANIDMLKLLMSVCKVSQQEKEKMLLWAVQLNHYHIIDVIDNNCAHVYSIFDRVCKESAAQGGNMFGPIKATSPLIARYDAFTFYRNILLVDAKPALQFHFCKSAVQEFIICCYDMPDDVILLLLHSIFNITDTTLSDCFASIVYPNEHHKVNLQPCNGASQQANSYIGFLECNQNSL